MKTADHPLAVKYAEHEAELADRRAQYDGFKKALGSDPALTSWVAGEGRMPKRSLAPFEAATVKRMQKLLPEISRLEFELEEMFVETIEAIANRHSDEGASDPETLLRAALVVMNKRHKAGDDSVELRLTMRAIFEYLKSLARDDDDG